MKMRDGVFICQQNTIWHLRLVNPMHFDMRGNACTIKKLLCGVHVFFFEQFLKCS